MKSIVDLLISAALLIILLPVMTVISLLILICNGLPVIYKHDRVGLNGKTFPIYKFRTMVKNADSSGSFRTGKNDPRVTRLGGFLRRTSLDELPQLWNVISGEMSLVGPRPFSPGQSGDYSNADWQLRHTVKPGITGLAQISGRSGIDRNEKIRYDLEYINRQNLLFDFSILGRTLIYIFLHKNTSN